jgi:hypothetical protein
MKAYGVRTYIPEKKQKGRRNWAGKLGEQQAVYANRQRVRGEYGKTLLRRRGELVERSFAHCYETGGLRRCHLRGREELFLDSMSTGAGNDIERATEMARKMVCEWGMNDLGPLTFGKKEEQIFLGREIAQHRDYSEATAVKIDEEVQKLVKRGYDTAKELLSANRHVLVRIALALIEREVLDAQQIKMIIEGQELPKIVPPPKPDDGVQQVIKPDLQPGRATGGERPAPA